MKHIYLSYPLANEIPVYGGRGSLNIKNIKSLDRGDSANVFSFTMENHWGTHIDAPNHFFENGQKASDYPPEFWFFKSPEVVNIHLKPSEVLCCGRWIEDIKDDCDILLFQSGWGKLRGQKVYSEENPGIHPESGIYLRKRYPHLRAIGIDWISISPYKNRELGRESHHIFLNPEGKNNPLVIIEDMDLSYNLTSLSEVLVFPLRIEDIDSAPCTVVGSFHD